MYDLGGLNLLNAGFTPIQLPESTIALTGFLDMPARIGKTFHEWAAEIGVEPYVSADEIFFGGRDLALHGVVTGSDQFECNDKARQIYDHIDGLTDLAPLTTTYGTYNVYVNAPIVGEYLPDAGRTKGIRLTIPLRQPVVPMLGTVPSGTSSEFGIDGISFSSLGGEMIELSGDRRNRTAPKSESGSGYGVEPYLITKTTAPILKLSLGIKQPTFLAMMNKVANITALFAAPGIRTLTVNNDKLRSFFVKDGFKATKVYTTSDWSFCLLECNLTEAGIAGSFADLVDSLGDIITDNDGNTIKIRL